MGRGPYPSPEIQIPFEDSDMLPAEYGPTAACEQDRRRVGDPVGFAVCGLDVGRDVGFQGAGDHGVGYFVGRLVCHGTGYFVGKGDG